MDVLQGCVFFLEKVDFSIWHKWLEDVSLWKIRKDVARLCAAYREGSQWNFQRWRFSGVGGVFEGGSVF